MAEIHNKMVRALGEFASDMEMCWQFNAPKRVANPKELFRLVFARQWTSKTGKVRKIRCTEYFFSSGDLQSRLDWIESEGHEVLVVKRYEMAK